MPWIELSRRVNDQPVYANTETGEISLVTPTALLKKALVAGGRTSLEDPAEAVASQELQRKQPASPIPAQRGMGIISSVMNFEGTMPPAPTRRTVGLV